MFRKSLFYTLKGFTYILFIINFVSYNINMSHSIFVLRKCKVSPVYSLLETAVEILFGVFPQFVDLIKRFLH